MNNVWVRNERGSSPLRNVGTELSEVFIKEEIVSEDYYHNENTENTYYTLVDDTTDGNIHVATDETGLHCELIIKEEAGGNEEDNNIRNLNLVNPTSVEPIAENGDRWKCDYCGKSYGKKKYLQRHVIAHVEIKPYECVKCGKRFRERLQLKKHEAVHDKFETVECDECKTSCTVKKCDKCNANVGGDCNVCLFKNGFKCAKCINSLSQRVVSDGDGAVGKFKCEKCDKSFATKKSMDRHGRAHVDYRPYGCDECGKSFAWKAELTRHVVVHAEAKSFKCTECDKGFISREYLLKHSIVHTNNKPFKCDVCGKGFNRKGDLKKHTMIHTGDKPFKCDVCQKQFNRNSELVKHYRTHTMEKPYVCDICKKCFGRKYTLNLHLKTHCSKG